MKIIAAVVGMIVGLAAAGNAMPTLGNGVAPALRNHPVGFMDTYSANAIVLPRSHHNVNYDEEYPMTPLPPSYAIADGSISTASTADNAIHALPFSQNHFWRPEFRVSPKMTDFDPFQKFQIAWNIIARDDLSQLQSLAEQVKMSRSLMRQIFIEICRRGRTDMAEFWLNKFAFAFSHPREQMEVQQDVNAALSMAVLSDQPDLISLIKSQLGTQLPSANMYVAINLAIDNGCNASLMKLLEMVRLSQYQIEHYVDQYVKKLIPSKKRW